MAPVPDRSVLTQAVLAFDEAEENIHRRVQHIQKEVLKNSIYIREPNFRALDSRDLDFLFHAYDEQFFNGLITGVLNRRRLTFRPAPRMTKSGGKTFRIQSR